MNKKSWLLFVIKFFSRHNLDIPQSYQVIYCDPRHQKAVEWSKNQTRRLFADKNYAEALRFCNKTLEYLPNDAESWLMKAIIIRDSAAGLLVTEALDAFNEALKHDGRNVKTYLHKGFCLMRIEKYEEAIKIYEEALIEANTTTSFQEELQLQIGICLNNLKRYAKALAHFNQMWSKVDRKQFRNARLRLYRAICLSNMREYRDALTKLENFEKVYFHILGWSLNLQ